MALKLWISHLFILAFAIWNIHTHDQILEYGQNDENGKKKFSNETRIKIKALPPPPHSHTHTHIHTYTHTHTRDIFFTFS